MPNLTCYPSHKRYIGRLFLIAGCLVGLVGSSFSGTALAASLLVGNFSGNSILRYNAATGELYETFVPAAVGGLMCPGEMIFCTDGNLYVSSYPESSIYRFDGSTGALIDIFADATSGLDGPRGLALGDDGRLYVNSANNNQILAFDLSTGDTSGNFVSGAVINVPIGLTFGPSGDLYVSTAVSEVLRFDGTTGESKGVFASGHTGIGQYTLFGPDGNLYVGSETNNSVVRFDGTTGAFIDNFVPSGSGGLVNPQGMVFVDGKLLVSNIDGDGSASGVLAYDATTGAFLETFIPSSSVLTEPTGLLYVGPMWQNAAQRLDTNLSNTITALDALVIINELNRNGSYLLPLMRPNGSTAPFYDADGDDFIKPLDALNVINHINSLSQQQPLLGPVAVPEPGTSVLVLLGGASLLGYGLVARRRRSRVA